jgi:predicted RNase H-like nuclease (RuvC/YqgF family)
LRVCEKQEYQSEALKATITKLKSEAGESNARCSALEKTLDDLKRKHEKEVLWLKKCKELKANGGKAIIGQLGEETAQSKPCCSTLEEN